MRALVWHDKRDVGVDTVPDLAHAYETFQEKQDGMIQDGMIKAIFHP